MDSFKTVTLRNGETVNMQLTEEWDQITFLQGNKTLTGEFKFRADNDNMNSFLLSRMYSPIKYVGLGEEALRFFKEETGNANIWTREPSDPDHGDGSHLTENAPRFIRKMQGLGLILKWNDPEDEMDYLES